MRNQVTRRLLTLADEISATQAKLDRLRERLEAQDALVQECDLRMLIAETPLADQALHAAGERYLHIEKQVRRVESALIALRIEEHRVASLLPPTVPSPGA